MIIYFCGWLDYVGETNLDPVVIRGYDTAGNLLVSIRHGQTPLTVGTPDTTYKFFSAYSETGAIVSAYTQDIGYSPSGYYPTPFPSHIAVDSNGHIYTVMNPVGIRPDGSITTTALGVSANVYIDKVRKHRRAGDRVVWPACPHNQKILAIHIDSSDNVYIGGVEEGTGAKNILHKYSSDGTLIWSAPASTLRPEYTDSVYAITTDSSGNVYTAGGKIYGGGLIRKYNSSGTLQWTQRPAGIQKFICLDSSDNLYTAGNPCYGYWITDISFHQWMTLPGWIGAGPVETDFTYFEGAENLYARNTFKWDSSDGSLLAFAGDNRATYGLAFDGTTVSVHYGYDGTIDVTPFKRRALSDLSVIHESNAGNSTALFADPNSGITYLTNRRRLTYGTLFGSYYIPLAWHFQGRDASHAEIWTGLTATQAEGVHVSINSEGLNWGTFDYGNPTTNSQYAALYATVEYTTAYGGLSAPDMLYYDTPNYDWAISHGCVALSPSPALPVFLRLKSPGWDGDKAVHPDGILITVSLVPPLWTRDYVGQPAISVYRLFLTGGSGPIELPIKSINCRKRVGAIDFSIVSPNLSSDQMSAINDRLAGDLVVYRGVRLPDQSEQMDIMLQAPLATVRHDIGTESSSTTLSGQSLAENTPGRSRTLRGISYRNSTNGTVRVRCAVDTYLSPGDTAVLPVDESWTVAEITYFINSISAFMEVTK